MVVVVAHGYDDGGSGSDDVEKEEDEWLEKKKDLGNDSNDEEEGEEGVKGRDAGNDSNDDDTDGNDDDNDDVNGNENVDDATWTILQFRVPSSSEEKKLCNHT